MVTFKLTHIEFSGIATFLEAESIPGIEIIIKMDDNQMLEARRQLQKHGFMEAGKGSDTWHINDSLIDVMLTVVSPERLVLVKDLTAKRSMQFCLDQDHITAVVVVDDGVVLVLIEDRNQMAAEAISFLRNTEDGIVATATVVKGEVVKGQRARISKDKIRLETGEQPLTQGNLLSFLQPS